MMTAKSALGSIDAIIASGKAVVSGDESATIASVQEAIRSGRAMTFYVSRAQFRAVMRWYWTPRRIAETGIELVSQEEMSRIESLLRVKETGELYSNRIQCPCGGVYGAFEFIEQGIREHGLEMVTAVLELEHASVIRVNPPIWAICPRCNVAVIRGHYYEWNHRYGCCGGEI